jgi:hypothetical protein
VTREKGNNRHLILYRSVNHKNVDAEGAFIPEAETLMEILHPGDVVRCKLKHGRAEFSDCIQTLKKTGHKDFQSLSLFCHGLRSGIEYAPKGQAGVAQVAHAVEFFGVEILNLFCCSLAAPGKTGGLKPSFFDLLLAELRDLLLSHRVRVFAHTRRGHTSWNPNIIVANVFRGRTSVKSVTVTPNFRRRMKKDQDFRLRLPYVLSWYDIDDMANVERAMGEIE